MAFILIPDEGEMTALKNFLADGGAAGVVVLEPWLLKLYKNDYTPISTSTDADFTDADFVGYAPVSLVRDTLAGHWSVPAEQAPTDAWDTQPLVAESTYAVQIWTGTGNTIYGYRVVGVTSLKVIWAQRFDTPHVLTVINPLVLTPRIGLCSSNPA